LNVLVLGQTELAPNRQSKEELSFGDSSGPFFSMYSEAAEDEDNKMVECWQKDADGILFFVSPHVCVPIVSYTDWNTRPVYFLPRSLHSLL
jgi:hypothetical protein